MTVDQPARELREADIRQWALLSPFVRCSELMAANGWPNTTVLNSASLLDEWSTYDLAQAFYWTMEVRTARAEGRGWVFDPWVWEVCIYSTMRASATLTYGQVNGRSLSQDADARVAVVRWFHMLRKHGGEEMFREAYAAFAGYAALYDEEREEGDAARQGRAAHLHDWWAMTLRKTYGVLLGA